MRNLFLVRVGKNFAKKYTTNFIILTKHLHLRHNFYCENESRFIVVLVIKGFPIRVICFEIEKKTLNIHSELIEIFFIILDILCHL